MKPWKLIDRARTPEGKTFSLHEHDGTYAIEVDGQPLMSTRVHTSEEKLAALACARLKDVRRARVLIGGLGFGFTLRAALSSLTSDATVIVAEIVAPVIAWNRDPALPLAAGAMADPRATVVERDVAEVIRAARREFDSIILDVDNGPAAMSASVNQRLYQAAGLNQIRAALRPGGCVGIWSAAPDDRFAGLLASAGFVVDVQRSRAHGNSGARHTIFLGRVP